MEDLRARIERCTVGLTLTVPHGVENDSAGVFSGTGVVVEQTQGIIVTAGHVASRGPFWGQAYFSDHSEVSVLTLSLLTLRANAFISYSARPIPFTPIPNMTSSP